THPDPVAPVAGVGDVDLEDLGRAGAGPSPEGLALAADVDCALALEAALALAADPGVEALVTGRDGDCGDVGGPDDGHLVLAAQPDLQALGRLHLGVGVD